MSTYTDFLAAKAEVAEECGFPEVDPSDVNPILKDLLAEVGA